MIWVIATTKLITEMYAKSLNPNETITIDTRVEEIKTWQTGRVISGLTKSRPHDRTVRRPRLHAVNSCAVVLVEHDRKQSTGVQSSGPRSHTHPGTPCQGRLVLVNTRHPCPCLLDRGTTAVSRRLVSVVPCSVRNEANSNLLLMYFSLSFIFKLLATLLLFYIPVIPLTNSILCSLRARSTPSTLYTVSGALLVFAILKLHGMLNLSSCGNAYTDSVRSCAVGF